MAVFHVKRIVTMLQQTSMVVVESLASALVGALAMGLVILLLVLLRPWRLVRWIASLGYRRSELESAAAAMVEATQRTESLEVVVNRLQHQVEDERRRATELFDRIEGVLKERDRWRDLCFEQATQHGAAQDLLFSELQALSQRLQKAGVDPRPNPRVAAVMSAYREEHLSDREKTAEKAQISANSAANGDR